MGIFKKLFLGNDEIYPPEKQGEVLLNFAQQFVCNEFIKQKDYLKKIGFLELDSWTFLRLTHFYLFFIQMGVQQSPIPTQKKDLVIKSMYDSYIYFLKNVRNEEPGTIKKISKLREMEVEAFQEVHDLMIDSLRDNTPMSEVMSDAAEILSHVWGQILSKAIDKKDLFESIPLAMFFYDTEKAITPIASDLLCKMNLTEKEYTDHIKIIEDLLSKSRPVESRGEEPERKNNLGKMEACAETEKGDLQEDLFKLIDQMTEGESDKEDKRIQQERPSELMIPRYFCDKGYDPAKGFPKKRLSSWQKPRMLLDEVQEVGGKLIISGYRQLARHQSCAPTSKTSDEKIIEIYKKVGTAFREASKQRGEHIPAGTLNFIVWKFLQMYEMMGEAMLHAHLEYEVNKYLREGLRPDYRQDLKIF